MWGPSGVITAARVDIVTSNNVTLEDAYQFDPPPEYTGGTGVTWGFTGQNFEFTVKGSRWQATGPYMQIVGPTGGTGYIVVQDYTNRILNFNVPGSVINATLPPGEYVYDFVMYDGSNPPVRVMLMEGKFTLREGIGS